MVAIADDYAGQRIDNFLRTQLKGVPKSMIYRILRKGEVRVNKKRVKPEYKLEAGDEVRIPPVRVAEREEETVSPKLQKVAALSDVILYEDDHILVLNKPSGTAVHGGSGLSFGVIEGLRALRPEARFLELVHRLDRDTSGVLLVAKKRSALRSLHEQLREKIKEHRESRSSEPLEMSASEIGQILQSCGIADEQVAAFQENCGEQFGSGVVLNPANLIDSSRFEIKTPEITISADPEYSYLVETQIINGRKYLLIPAEDGVEVNGFAVGITAAQKDD